MKGFNYDKNISEKDKALIESNLVLGIREEEVLSALIRYYENAVQAVLCGKVNEVDSNLLVSVKTVDDLMRTMGYSIVLKTFSEDRECVIYEKDAKKFKAIFSIENGYFVFLNMNE